MTESMIPRHTTPVSVTKAPVADCFRLNSLNRKSFAAAQKRLASVRKTVMGNSCFSLSKVA